MKILVTGTAGFIGYHLSKRLINEGHTVIGIDSINDYYDAKLKWDRLTESGLIEEEIKNKSYSATINYHFYKFDLMDQNKLYSIFKLHHIDAVCNLAAQAGVRYSLKNPMAYINSNIIDVFFMIYL